MREGQSIQWGGTANLEMGTNISVEWSKNKLVVFIGFVDLPADGFEKKILALLRKMEARKKKGFVYEKSRKTNSLSITEIELQNLEFLVKYDGTAGKVENGWEISIFPSKLKFCHGMIEGLMPEKSGRLLSP